MLEIFVHIFKYVECVPVRSVKLSNVYMSWWRIPKRQKLKIFSDLYEVGIDICFLDDNLLKSQHCINSK